MWSLRSCSAWLAACAVVVHQALAESSQEILMDKLDLASSEEEATAALKPHMDDLKALGTEAVEKVVFRQWWGLARELVAKSHLQQIDLSFAVRKAVRQLKDEADELLRTLNPKYGQAQQVSPAFQWAQNDTCLFLTIKYTVRWNAPGALEVTEPSVNMTMSSFNFSGLGKHSNNKYKYFLSLNLFDRILSEQSTWSAASVGKLSVTLRKSWPRKWPRLLATKKTKITNMHMWIEMQDKLESQLGSMTTVSNSPITCAASDKLYCLATDTCKKSANCSQCPGKTSPRPVDSVCAGLPNEKGGISFKDADMDEHEIGGEVKVSKAKNDFDIDSYEVYFGKDDTHKLENADENAHLGSIPATGADGVLKIGPNLPIPAQATHILVFSKNGYGEYATPGFTSIRDAVLPQGRPKSLSFEDTDEDKGQLAGTVTIGKAEDETHLQEYSLHWGKSEKRKIASNSFIRDVSKKADADSVHDLSKSTKIPEGATHILAFAKNDHGENPTPAAVKIIDKAKPCLEPEDDDCVRSVSISKDADAAPSKVQAAISFVPANNEEKVTGYNLYWGRSDCKNGGQKGAKNGYIQEVAAKTRPELDLPAGTDVPAATTHVLAFSKNDLGESDNCVAVPLEDAGAPAKSEL